MSEEKNWFDNDGDRDINDSYNANNNQYYQSPVNLDGTNRKFGGAALGCGISSLVTLLFGVPSVILGALGILFANLSRRRGKGYAPKAVGGLVMSIAGLVLGLVLTVNSVIYVYTLMNSDAFQKTMLDTYTTMYGEEYGTELYNEVMSLFGQ